MLKRLLDLVERAEGACRRAIGLDTSARGTREKPTAEDYARAVQEFGYLEFGLVYTHAILEGISEECAFAIGRAYAGKIAEGMSKAYSIVYAVAYSIARSPGGASERWARAYAKASAHAIAAQESLEFAAAYGHAIADGASAEDALVFARRHAV